MEVVENQQQLDEISVETIKSASKKAGALAGQAASLGGKKEYVLKKRGQQERLYKAQAKRRLKPKVKTVEVTREEYDLYDIILSHLLDEGYAETPEAAEVIMVNMSEDWRDSIVEEVLEEGWKTELAKKALKSVGKKIKKSKAYKKATRFATYTALGAIGLPLLGQ